MRARHRHFNPKDAGANIALDSRYGFSQSDGTAVSTWTSRTGSNNVTQSTGSLQPTYRTSIQGGQPVVRFDDPGPVNNTNATRLTNTSLTINQPFFIISANIANVDTSNQADYICDGPPSGSNRIIMVYESSPIGAPFIWAGGTGVQENTDRRTVWNIFSGLYNTTSSTIYIQGNQVATGSIGANNFSNGITIGARFGGSNGLDGDIAQFSVVSGTNQSLRKRCEHAAAYSFKIACS